jgi:porin
MAILTKLAVFASGLLLLVATVAAQQPSTPGFGSPNAVENQVESDFGETWDAWKQNLKDDLGLVLSVDYTAVMLTANETFDDKNGTGGIARIFGTFDLFNIENGTLVWKFEHRHAYGSVSPFDFSLGQIGYVLPYPELVLASAHERRPLDTRCGRPRRNGLSGRLRARESLAALHELRLQHR